MIFIKVKKTANIVFHLIIVAFSKRQFTILKLIPCLYLLDTARHITLQYMSHLRYWQNWNYHSASDNNRKETEKEAIIDELYKRSYKLVAAEPDKYIAEKWPFLYMHLEKKA